jgi:organic hydroperoxide reductase OsmC/OhrA
MPRREHRYEVTVRWTGNRGQGTASYKAYARDHEIAAGTPGKGVILGSSDPAFRGDPSRWNPEELFIAAVSACHKLWYLHLCAAAGFLVTEYVDRASGIVVEGADGAGHFTSVTLRPEIGLSRPLDLEKARALHHDAHQKCFIANSIKTPVTVEPTFRALDVPPGTSP